MEEDVLQEIQLNGKSRIIKRPMSYLYDIDIDDDIASPSQYREEREIMRSAGNNDVIRLNICCDGGRLDTTMALVANLRGTQASTIGVLESECHSGASILFLCCDEHFVAPHAGMLIHEASYGAVNSADKLHRQVEFSKKRLREVFEDVYEHFLTQEEIDNVLSGQDLWLGAEEIIERLKNRRELQEKELEESSAFVNDEDEADICSLEKMYTKKQWSEVFKKHFQNYPLSRTTKKEIIEDLLYLGADQLKKELEEMFDK